MKLSDYAKYLGISYQTAWRWWKAGKLPHPAHQTETGTVIVNLEPVISSKLSRCRVAIYARVSPAENRERLEGQVNRLTQYAMAKGYQVVKVVQEVGSGLNDSRKQLEQLLTQDGYDILLVEHKNRLASFGTQYLDVLLKRLGVRLEIANLTDNGKEELMQDLMAAIASLPASELDKSQESLHSMANELLKLSVESVRLSSQDRLEPHGRNHRAKRKKEKGLLN